MNADRTRRVEIAGANVEALLQKDPPDLQVAWNALDRAPPPSRDTLEKVTAERIALFRKERGSPGGVNPDLGRAGGCLGRNFRNGRDCRSSKETAQ
eukprot:scaffold25751_cov57-Attheya_sp.AAC.4